MQCTTPTVVHSRRRYKASRPLIMQSVDEDCKFKPLSKTRGGKDPNEPVYQITNDLVNGVCSQNTQDDNDILDLNNFIRTQ